MTFNISEFSARLSKNNGVAVSNLFMVRITPPLALLDQIGSNDLLFFCRAADIPGMNLQTVDYRPNAFGAIERRPVALPNEPLSTIFMVDGNFAIKSFFHRWMQLIVNYNNQNAHATQQDNQLPYEFGYKEDYASTVEVTMLTPADDGTRYTYTYHNAFPMNIGNVGVAWENSAEIMTMPVVFTYDKFLTSGTRSGLLDNLLGRVNGLGVYVASLSAFGVDVNNLQEIHSAQDLVNRLANIRNLLP